MSECVVRMDMPENCECCPMVYTADVPGYYWCAALEQEVEQGLSRPKDCPILCQLPEGHGDLIDRDSMVEEWVDEKIGNPHADYEADDVIYDLKKRTVIVPKDKAHEP